MQPQPAQHRQPPLPLLTRTPPQPAPRLPRILRPAPPPEQTRTQPLPAAPPLLTRARPLLTRAPLQPTRLQRLTRKLTRARNCPRPPLRCRFSACWDSVPWLPVSLAAKRNNQRSST